MIIAHLADLHLGFRQYHRQTPAGINQREADVANAFRVAVDQVIAAEPQVVLIAGDLFHSVRPTNAAIVFAFQQLQRLREALPQAPLILIAGNHDTPRSTETGSILSLFAELGVVVADGEPRRLVYPELDLSILAVPHQALAGETPVALEPHGSERWQVLMLHGEVAGVFHTDRSAVEYGGVVLPRAALEREGWSYVALGHYHVQHQVAPKVWYAGALEYVSTNPWGELRDEAARQVGGKGWLLADLAQGVVTPQPVPPARRVVDLDPIEGAGLAAAELDGAIAERVAGIAGGLADQVVRLVVRNVPRHVGRELDHTLLRGYKAEALHFQLDLRRPESSREVGVGSPGHRQTLPEVLAGYLSRRPLPAEVDRERFVRTGVELLDQVERELQDD